MAGVHYTPLNIIYLGQINNMAYNNTFAMFKVGETYMDKVPVGTKLYFRDEVQPYTVRASNRFYSVCTKPFNPQKTVLYTVVDWHNQLRGTEGLIFGLGAETDEECEAMLERLANAESDISSRNYCALDITKYKLPNLIK